MFGNAIGFIRTLYNTDSFLPLHEPRFTGNEKKYLLECIDSTFVSSVGKYVDLFEAEVAKATGAKFAVATVNGTAALHIALLLSGVNRGDEVVTQPLTFVATCNAISYCGAHSVFVDVDKDTLGMSPDALREFLEENAKVVDGQCVNEFTGNVIRACVPMHTFGHPCKIDQIKEICNEYCLNLVEDAAESLGSYYKGRHTGTFGSIGAISFNGNKIITSGGGGCIITDNELLATKAKHITTTAKLSHKWEYTHDEIAYNYRMPNINAALLVAQLENLEAFIENKRATAASYLKYFSESNIGFVAEPGGARSNYWLNAIILKDKQERDLFLKQSNDSGVMTRPVWTLMNKLKMFNSNQCGSLENSTWLEERVVNIPSSVRV